MKINLFGLKWVDVGRETVYGIVSSLCIGGLLLFWASASDYIRGEIWKFDIIKRSGIGVNITQDGCMVNEGGIEEVKNFMLLSKNPDIEIAYVGSHEKLNTAIWYVRLASEKSVPIDELKICIDKNQSKNLSVEPCKEPYNIQEILIKQGEGEDIYEHYGKIFRIYAMEVLDNCKGKFEFFVINRNL